MFEEQVKIFRKEQVSRVVFASGFYEHWDHTAVYLMGIYTSPQAGDPIFTSLLIEQAATDKSLGGVDTVGPGDIRHLFEFKTVFFRGLFSGFTRDPIAHLHIMRGPV